MGPETFRADLLHHRQARLNVVVRALIAAGVAALLLLAVALSNLWSWVFTGLPPVPATEKLYALGRTPGMTFLDRFGRPLATRGPRYGRLVTLAALPAYVPLAFVAVEDRRFRSHGAVDLTGAARAALVNLVAGRTVEGGSTITQQLARDLFLSPERTLRRKVQEAVMANRLAARLRPDAVLQLYLNRVYLGENAYGVEAGAQTYFGEPASSLSLAQAAVLAGLPKAPSRLSPLRDPAAAIARGRLVLARMRREGWISAADYARATAEAPAFVAHHPEGDLGWALDLASAQARSVAGSTAPDLIVATSIDPGLQAGAAEIVRDALDRQPAGGGAGQAAVVLLGPDGAVRALIGGHDHDSSAFDRAVQARRQPGSAFKPFVWAAALEAGDKPEDFRATDPVAFGPYVPRDHAAEGRAQLSLAEGLAKSSNRVAVRLVQEVGPDRVAALARRFGLASAPRSAGLSLALGTYETSLLELTSAYAPFQNGGRAVSPWLIDWVGRPDGALVWRRAPSANARVFDRALDVQMVAMMQGVIARGTGQRARLDRPAAGKTGTTQDNRDAWFVGFTPDWLEGVWVGNDDNRPMHGLAGGDLPADIWRRVMVLAHQGLASRGFDGADPGPAPAQRSGAALQPTVVFADRSAFYATLASEFARVELTGR